MASSGEPLNGKPKTDGWTWYVVGIRLDPDFDLPELYYLRRDPGPDSEALEEALVDEDGRPVLFVDPNRADALLDELAPQSTSARALDGIGSVCDVAGILHLVESGEDDPDQVILETVTGLLDLTRAVGQTLPDAYAQAVMDLAGHLGESADLEAYFGEGEAADGARQAVIDAVLWSVGAVTVLARFDRTTQTVDP